MAIMGTVIRRVGTAARKCKAWGAHNFERSYYSAQGNAAGDVRVHYEDLEFNDPKKGGEVIRARGIANSLLSAVGATINAAHFTGRVAAGKTVSGALNALRATLEVAGTNPTPGGTLAALQLDSNIVTGATMGAKDSFVRVSDSGAVQLQNLFYFEDDDGGCTENSDGTYSTADGYIKIYVEGVGAARLPYFLGTD